MSCYHLKRRHRPVVEMLGYVLTLQTDVEAWRGLRTVLKVRLSPFERGCIAAMALDAAEDEEAFQIIEALLPTRLAGAPTAPWLNIEDEARWWADHATPRELQVYLTTCFLRLSRREKSLFLAAARRRMAV